MDRNAADDAKGCPLCGRERPSVTALPLQGVLEEDLESVLRLAFGGALCERCERQAAEWERHRRSA